VPDPVGVIKALVYCGKRTFVASFFSWHPALPLKTLAN
jgi:hypothetical protein